MFSREFDGTSICFEHICETASTQTHDVLSLSMRRLYDVPGFIQMSYRCWNRLMGPRGQYYCWFTLYLLRYDNLFIFQQSTAVCSHLQMVFKVGVLTNFAIFTGKHQRWSLFFKETPHRCFPVNITKFLRRSFLKNIFEWLLLHLENVFV